MSIRVCIVDPPSAIREDFVHEIDPTLETFQDLIGGYIESITRENLSAYCDEEGRLKGLALNHFASLVLGVEVCGPVVFMGPVDSEGNETSVPDEFIQLLREATLV